VLSTGIENIRQISLKCMILAIDAVVKFQGKMVLYQFIPKKQEMIWQKVNKNCVTHWYMLTI
jgi:hypothetical protein